MSHTPWTDEEAEKAAIRYADDCGQYIGPYSEGFLKGVAWAAAQIEKCETVHGGENNMGTLSWSPSRMNNDTHSAKLVGVRTIDSDESGSGGKDVE